LGTISIPLIKLLLRRTLHRHQFDSTPSVKPAKPRPRCSVTHGTPERSENCSIIYICLLFLEFGTGILLPLHWLKLSATAIIFFYIRTYKNKEFYYYQNLGLSKTFLWSLTISLDLALYVLFLLSVKTPPLRRILDDFQLTFTDLKKQFPEFSKAHRRPIGQLAAGQRRFVELYVIIRCPSQFALLDEYRSKKAFLLTDQLYRDVISVSDELYVLADGATHHLDSPLDIQKFSYIPPRQN
jgi:hypothetical protein